MHHRKQYRFFRQADFRKFLDESGYEELLAIVKQIGPPFVVNGEAGVVKVK
jgi:hypothetical protein